MNVTVFGIGYVGLVQAAVLADAGHHVICVDVDETRVENLKKGIIPIYEPGLTPIVEENYKDGRLEFTTDAKVGVEHGDIQFIAVGTPPDEDGSADLKYVLAVAETIATHMDNSKIIINKSTVPVGTADKVSEKVAEILKQRSVSLDFHIVSNPEFLKEGSAVLDCQKPDRIVVGTDNDDVADTLHELYAPFNRNHDRMIIMDVKSAELTKYAANCMLATKITFMNEMANIAEKLGADIEAVRQGIGSDSIDQQRAPNPEYQGRCGNGGRPTSQQVIHLTLIRLLWNWHQEGDMGTLTLHRLYVYCSPNQHGALLQIEHPQATSRSIAGFHSLYIKAASIIYYFSHQEITLDP